jgi:DNA invertase Pin-like site-specific DNA recombinase
MRCAIYTRKSTEEGLAQEFNSLDAQRESAEAYIWSQRGAGWIVLPEHYDDGGYTGANLERPALRRLLTDIEAGRIDCVLVYKVDRLSRSLLDFARLTGEFDKRGVSLVSVTQQFNTTTSMGRLTLNILLSFAQFEREIIAERTRDKMAAARRKGKWVGGIPALGYDVAPGGGKLLINEEEARQVRAIFALYFEHRALLPVLSQIQRQQWTRKRWTTKNGRCKPGRPFASQDLLALLTNVIYVGKVRHQGQTYPGEQAAIVDEGVFQQVQVALGKSESLQAGHRRAVLTQSTREYGRRQVVNKRQIAEVPTRAEDAPRITRLMALAVKFEGLIQQGVVKDYAELARLGQVSRARITQIMNLLNLAPDIQEAILYLTDEGAGAQSIRETSVRTLSAEVIWSRQREQWKKWSARPSDRRQKRVRDAGTATGLQAESSGDGLCAGSSDGPERTTHMESPGAGV